MVFSNTSVSRFIDPCIEVMATAGVIFIEDDCFDHVVAAEDDARDVIELE